MLLCGRDISGWRLLRQLWGLTVRCERAMRAMAPHWQEQEASWGEAACLFERLASPALWLCQFIKIESEGGQPVPGPVLQLLASSAATVLKAARIVGIDAGLLLPINFVSTPSPFWSVTGARPATISLLLPRMAGASNQPRSSTKLLCAANAVDTVLFMSRCRAPDRCILMVLGSCHMATLVNKAAAELLQCSGTATRRVAHFAVGIMSFCAASLSMQSAGQGYEGVPSGSAQLRDLLARPLLQLLHSPLLDTLVALQHVMIQESSQGLQRKWEAGASICLRNQNNLSSTELDAVDAITMMQVGNSYYSGSFLSPCSMSHAVCPAPLP